MTPFRVIIGFIAISLFGLSFLPALTVDLSPSDAAPVIWINYSLPNASPEIIEQEGTAPLENILSQISDISTIKSYSHYNRGTITLIFDKDVDLDFKRFEVSSLIRQTFFKLHASLSYPTISINKDNRQVEPFLSYNISGSDCPVETKKKASKILLTQLRQIEGVSRVQILGTQDQQINIMFDGNLLRKYGVSKNDIIQALKKNFTPYHIGMVENSIHQQFVVVIPTTQRHYLDLPNVIVKTVDTQNKKTIKLKDITTLYLGVQDTHNFFRINGKAAVRMTIKADAGVNKIVLAETIKQSINEEKRNLPEGYKVHLDYDETEYIKEELIKIYYRTGLSFASLIIFILIIHRSWKYLAILLSSIVVNLSITTGLVYFLNIKIHLYTLAGITVSFGIIVDNAIVMLDHLNKHKNSKMFLPLLAASFTTASAILIVFLLPEEDKKNLVEFASIISINLIVSLLVAIGFTPAVYQLIFDKRTATPPS